jgi:hypothetical protein
MNTTIQFSDSGRFKSGTIVPEPCPSSFVPRSTNKVGHSKAHASVLAFNAVRDRLAYGPDFASNAAKALRG